MRVEGLKILFAKKQTM